MSILYNFLIFLAASFSVQTAMNYLSMLSLDSQARSNDVLSKRADARNVSVRYHDSINRLGHDSYCGTPSNLSHVENFHFAVNDCATLINTLAGNASAGYYSGWWDVKDWDYCEVGTYSWMMVAGWETCNFAVVIPECSNIATP